MSFESNLYTAQESDNLAGDLSLANGYGGVWDTPYWQNFETAFPTSNVMTMFGPWASSVNQQQASIERGQNIFNNRAFAIKNVAGFNNFPGLTNPAQGTCSTCHAQINMGSDIFPDAQRDIGIGGDDWYIGGPTPATDLPVFLLTCASGKTTPFNTAQVLTNDPGKALITGKCADIGTFTVPSLRGLAARAPYFTDGSAPRLTDVINFYNKRFNIGFSAQDVQDLVNFLNAM